MAQLSDRQLSSGYVQEHDNNGVVTKLWKEHGVYHIRKHDHNGGGRISWDTATTLTEARRLFAKAKRSTKGNPARRRNPQTEIRELELFIENDGQLYRQQFQPIQKNLVLKMAKGVYNHAGAVKLFGYLVTNGAKKYAKEFSHASDWNKMFTMADRKAVAESLAKSFEDFAKSGEYDDYLPAKYKDWRVQKNPAPVFISVAGKKIKAIAKRVAGKVKLFVTPATLRAHPELRRRVKSNPHWNIAAIKRANKAAGKVFFDKGHTRASTTFPRVYQGTGGVFFITKSRDEYQQSRAFSVWQFNPTNAAIRHEGTHPDFSSAELSAKRLAQ